MNRLTRLPEGPAVDENRREKHANSVKKERQYWDCNLELADLPVRYE
jgi:hypothetical protein